MLRHIQNRLFFFKLATSEEALLSGTVVTENDMQNNESSSAESQVIMLRVMLFINLDVHYGLVLNR